MLNSWIDTWSALLFPNLALWRPDAFQLSAPLLANPPANHKNGEFIASRYISAHGSLRYKLYVPSGYSGQALPLLVMLHGCKQNVDDFARGTHMNELAEQWQCFVVYPEQSPAANGARCWKWFDEANQQRGRGEPALIAGVTRKVMAEYAIDTSQVFAAGLSAGGSMAVILGQTYPDLFTAVGSHSGLPYAAARGTFDAIAAMRNGANPERLPRRGPKKTIPVIVFHGDRDATVHPKNGTTIIAESVAAASLEQGKHSPVPLVQKGRQADRAFTRKVHHDSAGEPVAEQWIVHGAGHAWSGGSVGGSYTDAKGPDAGIEMMRFFMPQEWPQAA